MGTIKVLIADDEDVILQILAKQVASAGYQVITAVDGFDAWEKIKSESPDIIILDLSMPRMDGYQVLEALRKNPPSHKWQPVIVVSAINEMQSLQESFNLEADHYLTKPCRIDEVIKAIRLMAALIPMRNA